jgi:hypothetical protein
LDDFHKFKHFLTFEKEFPPFDPFIPFQKKRKKKKEKNAYMATEAQKSLFDHHWMIVATFLSLPLSLI